MFHELSNKLLANAAVAAIVPILLLATAFLVGQDINKRVSLVYEKRQIIAAQNNAAKSLTDLKQDSEKAETYIKAFGIILPTKEELEKNFKSYLEGIARKNNSQIQFSFSESIASNGQEPDSRLFNLKVTASYQNLTNFLKVAEMGKYVIEWQSIIISKNLNNQQYSSVVLGKIYHE